MYKILQLELFLNGRLRLPLSLDSIQWESTSKNLNLFMKCQVFKHKKENKVLILLIDQISMILITLSLNTSRFA